MHKFLFFHLSLSKAVSDRMCVNYSVNLELIWTKKCWLGANMYPVISVCKPRLCFCYMCKDNSCKEPYGDILEFFK